MGAAGIDVAWPQGMFDWTAWAGRISFGMCKATEDIGLIDVTFDHNWSGMRALDAAMPRLAYHFFHAASDPVVQARFFVSTVRSRGLHAGDNLVADFEATDPDTGLNDGVEPAVFAERGRAFLHEVNAQAPGHRVLVYLDPWFAGLGSSAGMEAWHLFIANYDVLAPAVPAPWTTWAFWQTGNDPIDTDVFNGSGAELLAFTHSSG